MANLLNGIENVLLLLLIKYFVGRTNSTCIDFSSSLSKEILYLKYADDIYWIFSIYHLQSYRVGKPILLKLQMLPNRSFCPPHQEPVTRHLSAYHYLIYIQNWTRIHEGVQKDKACDMALTLEILI